jgi:hypothetical protein
LLSCWNLNRWNEIHFVNIITISNF